MVPLVEAFLSHFKGVKIVSTDPLTIETYDDTFQLDAEWTVTTWYPAPPIYPYGTAPWQVMALGYLADSQGELAFSTDKAGTKQIEWLSLIAGPSIDILKKHVDAEVMTPTLVYTPTLSAFITPEETAARWNSLKKWFSLQGHFWLGTGPYWLDKAFPIEKTLTLRRFEAYPDPASKWAGFGAPMIAVVEVDGPGQVKIGDEATYDVFVTFEDKPYPAAQVDAVKYLVFDSAGATVAIGDATAAEEGHYTVTLSKDVTSKLAAGSNKLEVVFTSKAVSIPTITDYEFVTQ
jgi:peptide/nickel transport system substrate-binding protein